ncbi:EAL domain-containing protein [Sphingomonas sp.]|uniref:EAL domain-containing protein n=1 Tax=Sphingomonas sp. TaxID=28214 RepID=UPI00286CC991|nr:EAL domain-containing protein [Sphingomonas sp.]
MIETGDIGLLDGFERALLNDRLRLAYQPKISLEDGSLKRVEALVRWDDAALGSVAPSRFVPLAEKYGLIDQLTQWGLSTALQQWCKWRDEEFEFDLAFNISALSLEKLDFPDLVERMCREHGVPTERLVLELTESATQPLINLMDTLTRFRIKGIGLAIDDFGTGYSTLMQLRQLPFTEMKIDRFFLTDMIKSDDSRLIVRTMIDLAHGLRLTVTAEGVETAEQLLMLREMGCDVAQGYLVSAALAPDTLSPWYDGWRERWPGLVSATRPARSRARS